MNAILMICLLIVLGVAQACQNQRMPPPKVGLLSAVVQMEPLLKTHERIVLDLNDYIQREEKRLNILRKYLDTYKEEHERAMSNPCNYLGNPIQAFTLIKRLNIDLDDMEEYIKLGIEQSKKMKLLHIDLKYPTLADLSGAAQAISRIQKTYRLDVNELSEGVIHGVAHNTVVSAGDCYELGRTLYNEAAFDEALQWMLAALRKYQEELHPVYRFNDVKILEFISFCYFMVGDIRNAVLWNKRILDKDPENKDAVNNMPLYINILAKETAKHQRRGETGVYDEPELNWRAHTTVTSCNELTRKYESLCRGESQVSSEVAKNLTCRYLWTNDPFFKIAPIKLEQLYKNPDIYIFYEILSNTEINILKKRARQKLKPALVLKKENEESLSSNRVAMMSWLDAKKSEVATRISKRISYLTGLSMHSSEELQIVNYGLGGHYTPHYDFIVNSNNGDIDESDRLATFLFYLSDVPQGGATVFTELGLSVSPVKGAGLFWRNLLPSGEGDMATLHAACPVLRGSKWVATKWISRTGQKPAMTTEPCDVTSPPDAIKHRYPRSMPKPYR